MLVEKHSDGKLAITFLIMGTWIIGYHFLQNKDGRKNNEEFQGRDQCSIFIGTNYVFSKSDRGDAEVERKHHDLREEKLLKARDKWNEYRMKKFDFSIKGSVREMNHQYPTTTLVKQCLSAIEQLQNK